MSKRTPNLLVEDIIDSANKILDYTKSLSFQEFTKDGKTIDAVIRNFEIIGEAQIDYPKILKTNIPILTGIGFGVLEIGSFMIILALIVP